MRIRWASGKFRVATDNNRKFTPFETGNSAYRDHWRATAARACDLNGIYQFSDNFSIIRGRHNFKIGIEISPLSAWTARRPMCRSEAWVAARAAITWPAG